MTTTASSRSNVLEPVSVLVESKDKTVPWWRPLPDYAAPTRDLLMKYVGMDEGEVDSHIAKFREEAWNIRPYPCVGMFAFLKPITQWAQFDHEYDDILECLKSGGTMIDVGCAMAQDLRRLAADGAPSSGMCAVDITPDFWEASFDLFRDRSTMQAQFFCCDVFDVDSNLIKLKTGAFDVLVCGDFFHLFDWERQIEAGVRVIGSNPGKAVTTRWGDKDVMFFHDEHTFRQMWSEVGKRTQTRWEVKCRVASFGEGGMWSPKEDFEWMGKDRHGIQFAMRRL